ncbi:MAG: PTS sugar transporter subunit IIA [Myxococcota bacterium]
MIGLVIASHGHLAEEFVATARQIVGELTQIASCSVEPGASPESLRQRLADAVRSVDEGQGVVVLADLLGGTPCNQSLSLCQQSRLEVVTGVNLPMVLKAASLRQTVGSAAALADQLAQYGQRNIACVTERLRSVGS